jgi:hypothetical protein
MWSSSLAVKSEQRLVLSSRAVLPRVAKGEKQSAGGRLTAQGRGVDTFRIRIDNRRPRDSQKSSATAGGLATSMHAFIECARP